MTFIHVEDKAHVAGSGRGINPTPHLGEGTQNVFIVLSGFLEQPTSSHGVSKGREMSDYNICNDECLLWDISKSST